MQNTGRLVDILDRMENGPIIDEKEFDMKIISDRIQSLVKEFNIKREPGVIVNTDDDLADRCFEAGMVLAAEAGVFCKSSGRRMLWSRREIEDGIKGAPGEMTLGFGRDAHWERARQVEDPHPPTILGGSVGIVLPEELFIPVTQSYVQEPLVDALLNSTLETVYGRPPRTRSPWEILSGWHEAELSIAACRRAGREGISIGCVAGAASDITELSATSYGGFRKTDFHMVGMISELKVTYELLNKLAHLVRTDSIIHAYYNPIYGGMCGGPEGMAVLEVAGMILLQMVFMASTHSGSPTHPFMVCNSTPDILWQLSLYSQALARNSHLMTTFNSTIVGGPGTKNCLYESAAGAITGTVSGITKLMGPRPSTGARVAECSGLEARFFAEVAHAASGISREEGGRLVRYLLDKYEADLPKGPQGQRFDEVYDLHTLKPKPHWLKIYDEVKEELTQVGLKFK
jgi:methylamine---corrinoid protein Co-methyltransferase